MNGRELINKQSGGKAVWREGMCDELRRLKLEYQYAKQTGTADTFKFSARYHRDLGRYECMRCGTLMDDRSKIVSDHLCSNCGLTALSVGVSTHTYLPPDGTEDQPKIISPAGS